MPSASDRVARDPASAGAHGLSWFGIVRLGLVQTALGAIVVLTTSTMNRVMVVELALPAMLPGFLVGLHYAIQMLRPRLGYGSDVGGRRTPWILGGMAVLGLGGTIAAWSIMLMSSDLILGVAVALGAFLLIGLGVGAAGTSLLVLLAKEVAPARRPAAATLVWMMMILGFVVTASIAGGFLDPYSPLRLLNVTGTVALIACLVTVFAVWRIESAPGRTGPGTPGRPSAHAEAADPAEQSTAAACAPTPTQSGEISASATPATPFFIALKEIWAEPEARLFTIFVFMSMLAYSAQDLVLEPFAGAIFGMTPGESTKLAGVQHGGVLLGMLMVALAGRRIGGLRLGSVGQWMQGGCLASAVTLCGLLTAAAVGPDWPLKPSVFLLGLANGAFAVAAIGMMMNLAHSGRAGREGIRMGLWGAAQAIAFGVGGLAGTVVVDICRWLTGWVALSYGMVFLLQAILFSIAALIAARINRMHIPIPGRQAKRPLHPELGLETMAAASFER